MSCKQHASHLQEDSQGPMHADCHPQALGPSLHFSERQAWHGCYPIWHFAWPLVTRNPEAKEQPWAIGATPCSMYIPGTPDLHCSLTVWYIMCNFSWAFHIAHDLCSLGVMSSDQGAVTLLLDAGGSTVAATHCNLQSKAGHVSDAKGKIWQSPYPLATQRWRCLSIRDSDVSTVATVVWNSVLLAHTDKSWTSPAVRFQGWTCKDLVAV